MLHEMFFKCGTIRIKIVEPFILTTHIKMTETSLASSWVNFTRGIASKATLQQYSHSVRRYMTFLKVKDPDDLLMLDKKSMEDSLMEFIQWQKDGGVGSGLIRVRMAAIKKFYKRNRVSLDWDLILETIGKPKKLKKDRAYMHEELRKMLAIANYREKVMVLVPASSGVRRGGLLGLRLRNLKLVKAGCYDIYQITVYEGEPEEYTTYCTPECKNAIDEYIGFRERAGEKLTPDSWLIRDAFFPNDLPRAQTPRPISERTYNDTIERLMERAGVRKSIMLVEGQKPSQVRHDVKTTHGFRKFFDTQMTLSGISELYTQILEGHEIGLKGAYLRPTEDDLLYGNDKMHGYVAAIDALTINEENRLKKQVVVLEQELEKAAPKDIVYDLAKENKDLRQQMADMQKNFQLIIQRIDVAKLE
jgi:site-specific recombinase XerD